LKLGVSLFAEFAIGPFIFEVFQLVTRCLVTGIESQCPVKLSFRVGESSIGQEFFRGLNGMPDLASAFQSSLSLAQNLRGRLVRGIQSQRQLGFRSGLFMLAFSQKFLGIFDVSSQLWKEFLLAQFRVDHFGNTLGLQVRRVPVQDLNNLRSRRQ
jgi:hypothetical protein